MTAMMLNPTRNPDPDTPAAPPLRWLFVKERFAWPRASGHDVHTYGMMRALADQGQAVSLLTLDPAPEEALAGVNFASRYCLAESNPPVPRDGLFPLLTNKSQVKFQSYWGIRTDAIRQVAAAAADCEADAVVVSGLNVLPYLGAVGNRVRIWYAADEWVWHHLSMVKPFSRSSWSEIKPAIVKGFYERAYRKMIDRVWVVTDRDAQAFRWIAGVRGRDVIPNGVDTDHYSPLALAQEPKSCAFWGRLDFGPNIQALEWFCRKVWPRVRAQEPDAKLKIFGFQPTSAVEALARTPGAELYRNLPDLRSEVQQCQVAVLPFVSGGGIKNKLLEAAAMGMPIVSTPRGCLGLRGVPPFEIHTRPGAWVDALTRFWSDKQLRMQRGTAARAWVEEHHTWAAAARSASEGVRLAMGSVTK